MRLRKYMCPGTPLGQFKGECMYPWEKLGGEEKCLHCGVSYNDQMTIWDKMKQIYLKLIPYDYRPGNWWYRIKCWAWYRYTTVKPRTLSHTWYDRSGLIIHVMFEVLCQFVEKELSQDIVNWEATEEHSAAKKEMLALYNWWTKEYTENYPYNLSYEEIEKLEQSTGKKSWEIEEQYEEEIRQKCKRLIDVSPYMWT